MTNTKIDWCDSTWNPITGCRHGCPYCYAKDIANRFATRKGYELVEPETYCVTAQDGSKLYEMNKQAYFFNEDDFDRYPCAYPHKFEPTLHRYRMDEYKDKKKSRNIFVGSMTDIFAEYIPERWRREVFNACKAGGQHNYLFLTKNPAKYHELAKCASLPDGDHFWYGSSTPTPNTEYFFDATRRYHTFLSVEPMLENFAEVGENVILPEWIIIGAETGNRKEKLLPSRVWIEYLVNLCRERSIPVFMKSSLKEIWGVELLQEFPKALIHEK